MKIISTAVVLSAFMVVSCKNDASKTTENQTQTVQEQPLLATLETSQPTPAEKVYYVNAQSGLSLREGITLRSKKKLTLPYGAQVTQLSTPAYTTMTIEGITGDMVEVDYQGAKGFVFNGYLTTLAPPLKEERVKDYVARISAQKVPVTFEEIPAERGQAYGMTTSLTIPARSWKEAYVLAKMLFDIPKGISFDANATRSKIENPEKRRKTLIDELEVHRQEKQLNKIVYTYALKEYKRAVEITKAPGGYLLKETEQAL